MSDENEMREVGAALDQLRRDRHAAWHQENMEFLRRELPGRWRSADDGQCIMFREFGRPKVDFYPSTGRWREPGGGARGSGGAVAFAAWYRKQG